MSAARLLLTIDAGSSGTRVAVLDATGALVAMATRPALAAPRDGRATVSAEQLWAQVAGAVREVVPDDAVINGIAVAAQLGVVLVDEHGTAIGEALLWPDERAGQQALELAERYDGSTARLGRRVSAEMPACKLMWWSEHRASDVRAARWILSLKDYLVLRLTGVAVTDETHASYTGWYDVAAREYSADLIERSGVDGRLLAPVRPAGEPAGVLRTAELGLPVGIPVAVGAPDGTAGALGAGGVRPGVTVDIAGTTDVLLSVVDRPVREAEGAIVNAYAIQGTWVVGGPTGMTGGAVEWVARLLGFGTAAQAFEELGDEAMALPMGAAGLSFTPSLTGSRMPIWSSGERGVLAGIAPHHGRAHVLRAACEGAAFAVGQGIEALRASGATVDAITMAGGVTKRPDLVELRAGIWALPVSAVGGNDATTVGTAMLAGVAAGVFADLQAAAERMIAPSTPTVRGRTDSAARDDAARRWQIAAGFAAGDLARSGRP